MSKIQKLSILGIRSFDNTQSATIQFYSPLTLIVGYNGSGKTTIIECLKYATTGDQPPNSKGGAFVHDPSICGEKEVLAQVKLSFRSTSDAHMVITRSLQLSVKKATRSLKTLEGQLLMLKDGDRIAISSRVAELDQIMPQYLGVSKAILDNVVFCHQDESLWPMSEPSVLKKKFDEIFEALKYTKAIDNIKVLKKKQTEELGKLKLTEQHEKENKDKGEKAEKRSVLLRDEIQKLRSDADDLNKQAETSQRKANEAFDHASNYERIVVELSGKRMQASSKQESIAELKDDIQEMEDSDEALKSMLEQYDERTALCSKEIENQKQKYSALAQQLKENHKQLGTKQKDQGQYEGEKNQYEHQLQEREKTVKEAARQHNIRGFDYDLNDARIRDFMERLAKIARDQSAAIERAHEESQSELGKTQLTLNQLNEQKAALTQSKEHAKSQISLNDEKLSDQDRALQSIHVDEGAKVNLETSVQNLRQTLQSLNAKAEAANWDQNIRNAEEEIRVLEEKKEKLDAEMLDATRHAQETAQIDHLRRSLKENETGLETMKGAHGTRLTQLIGSSWQTSEDIEAEYQAAVDSKVAKIKDAQSRADQLGIHLSQVNYKIASNKQETKTKLETKNQYEKAIKEATGEEDLLEYHAALQSAEKNVETLKKDLVFSKWYVDVKETFDQHDCCRLCSRTFSRQTDRNDFKEMIRKFTEGINANEMAEELEQAEQDLRTLRNVSTTFDNWRALTQTEIPSLKRDLLKLEADQKQVVAQSEKADQEVKDLESAKRELDVILQNVKRMAKYQSDIKTYQQQIEGLTQKASTAGLSRGTEAINGDQKKVGEQYRLARKKLDSNREDRDGSRNKISKLEIEVRDANEKLQNTVGQLKERDTINQQREEILKLNKEKRSQISDIDEKLQHLAPQISQCQASYDDIQRRGREKQQQLQAEATKITGSLDQLNHAETVVKSYVDRGGPQQLARVEKEIADILQEQQRIEKDQVDLTKEINALKQQTERQAETKRGIERNLKYRRDQAALKQLHQEIAELESHHAEADRERYMVEGKEYEDERIRLSAQAASILGEAKSKDVELKRILDDWNTDYKDAKFKHREANVKVQATKAAVEDLARYGGALDKAIMKYHSLKMDEINTVIEELWRKTYQGTDIDTILIRSDNDNVKGNKSYNYRVCMVKQDAEMDMRGRCSAGQKVLASIIIRLALAECFGVSCGLIALDEPTTNLDRDNIRSLAMALHDIIKIRQQQSNFQLIVITHDEEFLRFMRCQDFCDYYYRVSRDERQKSQIERQSLAEVM